MSAPDLAQLQRTFQAAVLRPSPSQDESSTRLNIYATAYRLRLSEALAHNYPMLERYLHPDEFAQIALDYLAEHPSTSISVRDVGDQLPSWLANHCSGEPWLAEFARFEWHLASAFDALDSPLLAVEQLAAVNAADWPALTFKFTPATQRLTLHTNAPQLYRSIAHDETAPEAQELNTSCEWLIWRRDTSAQYRSLTAFEALAIDTLLAGGTFGDMCEAMFDHSFDADVAAQAAAFLKRWIEDQLVADYAIAHS